MRWVLLAVLLLILLCLLLLLILQRWLSPTADAGGPYTVNEAQELIFDGSGSGLLPIIGYTWDFGDGTSGSGAAPSHTYEDGPAQFTVQLTVNNILGRTASDSADVTVNNLPPSADAGGPYTCQVNGSIQLSGTCDDPSPVDAASLTCTWADFSGAALSQPIFTCPPNPGQVTVTLTATDKDGASAQDSTEVNVAGAGEVLKADADGPYSGLVDTPISFDGSASTPAGAIQSYTWDFGDGGTGTGMLATHSYTATGVYSVTLTVSDGVFQDTDITRATISATQLPEAIMEISLIPKTSQCYRFDGSASTAHDGEIVSYAWDFGDGNEETGEVVEYCYQESGTYTVTLTVTDERGAVDSVAQELVVSIDPY
ncbi:MAG: hypothetical protein Kow0063_06110 [Anaerolineae bacterium]